MVEVCSLFLSLHPCVESEDLSKIMSCNCGGPRDSLYVMYVFPKALLVVVVVPPVISNYSVSCSCSNPGRREQKTVKTNE